MRSRTGSGRPSRTRRLRIAGNGGCAGGRGRSLPSVLRAALCLLVTAYKYLNSRAALGIGLRYALSRRGSLAESYVATGGYMRSDPALAVSDTIVVMIPALITRGGVGFRLADLFPERHGFTVMVGRSASG
jgi:hypothetical protein